MSPAAGTLDRDDLTPEDQSALESLLFRLADDEFVHGERLTEWQIFAPTLESDLSIANIAQDEFGHARLWYDLLQELGYTESECVWERPPEDWQHSILVERPFDDGDWADAVVRSYLYDVAERIRLEALVDTSYAPLADRVGKALDEESYHREHAQNWLERLTADPDTHDRVQAALDELFGPALTLFAAGEYEETITEAGFRTATVEEMRSEWLDTVSTFLTSLDLTVPNAPSSDVSVSNADALAEFDAYGRDGSHTDAWVDLYEQFTATYRELELDTPARLRSERVSQ